MSEAGGEIVSVPIPCRVCRRDIRGAIVGRSVVPVGLVDEAAPPMPMAYFHPRCAPPKDDG